MMKAHSFSNTGTWIFFAISLLDVTGVVLNNSLLQLIFKPLIMPSLILLYYISSKRKNKWYIVAMVFSFLGDVLLLDKSNMFLYGIAAFLITQLVYVFIISKELPRSHWKTKLIASIPFLAFFIILIKVLKPGLGEFFLPVVIYGAAISVFGMVSLLNYTLRKDNSSLVLLLGAVLFILSDSMIALNKFYEAAPLYGLAIMVTYILAQYLIFRYMLTRSVKELPEEEN
jgi:uncharacterized membrane protein YhhN